MARLDSTPCLKNKIKEKEERNHFNLYFLLLQTITLTVFPGLENVHRSWYKKLVEVVYRWVSYFCKSIFLLDICVGVFCFVFTCIYVWMFTSYMSDASRGQKMSLDPMELALRKVVDHHLSAGNQSQVFCKKKCT